MITLSHVIYGWAAAKALKPSSSTQRIIIFGVVIGSFLPDIPTYLFFLYYTVLVGSSQADIWNTLYFNSPWTPVITLTHSFIIWPLLFGIGYIFKKHWLFWIASGALFHSAVDFLVHNTDAYAHFWPLSDWKFFSPVSYWNPEYYGSLVSILDTVVVFALLIYLLKKTSHKRTRWLIIFLAILYLAMNLAPYFINH